MHQYFHTSFLLKLYFYISYINLKFYTQLPLLDLSFQAGPIIDFRSMINEATRLNVEEGQDDRLLKPLGGYLGYSNEWRELAQVISRVGKI